MATTPNTPATTTASDDKPAAKKAPPRRRLPRQRPREAPAKKAAAKTAAAPAAKAPRRPLPKMRHRSRASAPLPPPQAQGRHPRRQPHPLRPPGQGIRPASNQEMFTAVLSGLVSRFNLQGERLGMVAGGAVLKHSRDFNLIRESVLGSEPRPTPRIRHPAGVRHRPAGHHRRLRRDRLRSL